jgi:hypothetical protein
MHVNVIIHLERRFRAETRRKIITRKLWGLDSQQVPGFPIVRE